MIIPGDRYQHYKGKKYKILFTAFHTEDEEWLVVYQALYDDPEFGPNPIFAKPKAMFLADVIFEGKTIPRFTKIL